MWDMDATCYGKIRNTPKMEQTEKGIACVQLSVAVCQGPDRNDELYSIWVYVICFGALAHRMALDASKGQEVCCDGFLAHRKWKNRDGSKGHRLNLIARAITLF